MVFKIKDIANERSKGSRCDQMSFVGVSKATKNDAIEILNNIIISPEKYAYKIDKVVDEKGAKKGTKKGTKDVIQKVIQVVDPNDICCKQELILRLYEKEERLNKKWFISPSIAILINFEND